MTKVHEYPVNMRNVLRDTILIAQYGSVNDEVALTTINYRSVNVVLDIAVQENNEEDRYYFYVVGYGNSADSGYSEASFVASFGYADEVHEKFGFKNKIFSTIFSMRDEIVERLVQTAKVDMESFMPKAFMRMIEDWVQKGTVSVNVEGGFKYAGGGLVAAPDISVSETLSEQSLNLPGVDIATTCPGFGQKEHDGEVCEHGPPMVQSIRSLIMHLNDDHRWTRDQIADWIDELADSGLNFDFPDP